MVIYMRKSVKHLFVLTEAPFRDDSYLDQKASSTATPSAIAYLKHAFVDMNPTCSRRVPFTTKTD
jgi:hypothetical protein